MVRRIARQGYERATLAEVAHEAGHSTGAARAGFTYRDGVAQTATLETPCEPDGGAPSAAR